MNSQCNKVRAWLPDYADGVLAGRRLRRLQTHLAGCPDCRLSLQQAQQALADFDSMETLPADAEAAFGRFQRRLAHAEPASPAGRRGFLHRGWPLMLAGATAAAAGLVVIWKIRPPDESPEPPGPGRTVAWGDTPLDLLTDLDLLEDLEMLENLDGLANLDAVLDLDLNQPESGHEG